MVAGASGPGKRGFNWQTKAELKVPASAKLFIVSTPYAPFKQHLIDRGWVENPDFFSSYFDLKYCVRLKDIDYKGLFPNQIISHYVGQTCLTNKFELSRSLTNLISDYKADIDDFFPRCYDISCFFDHMNFLIDFKISFCVSSLKKYLKALIKARSKRRESINSVRKESFSHSKEDADSDSKSRKDSKKTDKKSGSGQKGKKVKSLEINFDKILSKTCEILMCKVLVCITCILRYCRFLQNKSFFQNIVAPGEFDFLKNVKNPRSALSFVETEHPKYVIDAIDRVKPQVAASTDSLEDFSDILTPDSTAPPKPGCDDQASLFAKKKNANASLNDEELRQISRAVDFPPEFISERNHPTIDLLAKNAVQGDCSEAKETGPKVSSQEEYNFSKKPVLKPETPGTGTTKRDMYSMQLLDELIAHSAWTLRKYKSLNPQYSLLDTANLWIQKPNGSSRGRGIRVFTNLEDIEAYWAACDCDMVVMKYIERPLLIRRRKFDIRHWVVISNLDPVCVWSFEDYYIRLSLNDYNEQDPDNIFAHLTNNSVAKKNKKLYSQIYAHSMLTKKQFIRYCKELSPDFSAKSFHKQMQSLMVDTIQSGQFNLVPRRKSFTVLGFDLMVDTAFKIWLIEVNSSPSMETNTNVTELIVPEFFRSLAEAMCDRAFLGNGSFPVGAQIRKLRLIAKKQRRV